MEEYTRQKQAQTALEIKQTQDTPAEKTRLRAVGYQQELAGLAGQRKQALDAQSLTEQQRIETEQHKRQQKYAIAQPSQATTA